MNQITLTCAGCGKTETVDDTPENRRATRCNECGESMVEDRPPGGGVTVTTPVGAPGKR